MYAGDRAPIVGKQFLGTLRDLPRRCLAIEMSSLDALDAAPGREWSMMAKPSQTDPETEISVVTANGLKGTAARPGSSASQAGELLCVTLEAGRQLWVAPEMLIPQADGHYLLPISVPKDAPAAEQSAETTIVPVLEETAEVQKRQFQSGGVRVSKVVHERQEQVDTSTVRERVDVRREPVDEFVTEPEQARQEGEQTIIPIYEEVVVVAKRLRLKERLIITKRRETEAQSEPVALRREAVVVERLPGEASAEEPKRT